jgi:hypothetical protein
MVICAVLQSLVIHTDDTPVKLQELATHRLSTARLGATASPQQVGAG